MLDILRKEENAASNYQWSALSQTREDALNYYDREPYGDEQDGASQVVTSEFADVIESIMPGLMRVFTSTDDVAEFTPGAPGEEQWAKEASEYVPHVFMRQNDGFRILYWMIKDALMYRLGAVTVDLEDYSEKRRVPVQGLPQDAIDLVVAQAAEEGAELAMELEQDPAPSSHVDRVTGLPLPPSAPTFSGTIAITHKRKRVVADNIAPEDILFTPTARDQDKASFLGFRKRVTASDLVEMGLSQDEVDALRLRPRPLARGEPSATTAPSSTRPSAEISATASGRSGWSWPMSAPTPTATASASSCAWSMPMPAARRAASSSASNGTGWPRSRSPRRS